MHRGELDNVRVPEFTAALPFKQYLTRMMRKSQMDLDYTFTQMAYLCFAPRKVYRLSSYRKQTKNQFARDDPAFVVILIILLTISATSYSLAFHTDASFSRTLLHLLLYFIGFQFLVGGLLVTTLCWAICNRYLRVCFAGPDNSLEWLYGFDIHCNAFFPHFLLLHVLQYILLPLLIMEGMLPALLSNLLYLFAVGYYSYVTSLGYSKLPFLERTEIFLYPVVISVLLAFVGSLLQINATRISMWVMFG